MQRIMFKSKIHRATVTQADLHYEGSITIDQDLLDAADMLAHEWVSVLNITNGERIETYTLPGERGSGVICLNGAAARRFQVGDLVIIITRTSLSEADARAHVPRVVLVDEHNRVKSSTHVERPFTRP